MRRASCHLACLALSLAAGLAAQAPTTGAAPALPPLGEPAALPDGAPEFLATITRADLQRHACWLADDARAGRHTGGRGQQETAAYVAEHYKKYGLKPLGDKRTFLQSYPLVRVQIDAGTSLAFGGTKITTDLAVLPASPKDKVALSGRFVWCGNGTAAAVPAGLAGRIPLVVLAKAGGGGGNGASLQAVQRYLDIADKIADQGGSAAVVCLLDDGTALGNALNYRALLPDHPKLGYRRAPELLPMRVPLLVLSAAQSRRLFPHLGIELGDDGLPTSAITDEKAAGKLTIAVKADEKAAGVNVVAVLEGTTRKSEAIVFSAHHDHVGRRLDGDVFNGADDNASGTAGLLEIAEAFARAPQRPERSMVFLSVSGEELGLWGSHWYSEHPTWPLDKIVANVNIDMIGRALADDGSVRLQVTPSHQHPKFSTIARDGVAIGRRFGIQFASGDQYYTRSDHFNFAAKGVPVVFFCDGEHPDYHMVTDTADRLDYPSMEAIARTAAWTGYEVARAKVRPQELGPQPDWQ